MKARESQVDQMEISFKLAPEDGAAWVNHRLRSRPNGIPGVSFGLAAGIATALIVALMIVRTAGPQFLPLEIRTRFGLDDPGNTFYFLVLGTLLILGGMLYLYWRPIAVQNIQQDIQKSDFRHHASRKTTLSPGGLTVSTAMAETTYRWECIRQIEVTKNHAFFVTNLNAVEILPRRVFATDDDFLQFVQTAEQFREGAAQLQDKPDTRITSLDKFKAK
jgi:hypothetical protein